MLASSRFRRFEECNILLSKLASEDDLHLLTFYEGVNPISGDGGGSYPFGTGIYAVRTAIDNILKSIESKNG